MAVDTARRAYRRLLERSRELAQLRGIMAALRWDEQLNLPRAAAPHRARELAYLARLLHQKATGKRMGAILSELAGVDFPPDSAEAANLRLLARQYERLAKIPPSLMSRLAHAATLGQSVWAAARRRADFALILPQLSRLVALRRKMAACLGWQDEPYDALLQNYDPEYTTRQVEAIFSVLKAELVPLLAALAGAPQRPDGELLRVDFPLERQQVFGRAVAVSLGFDFDRGRLDTSLHPFCEALNPGDCRMTTRYDSRWFPEGFYGIVHEVGHGLYEQGLPESAYGTPLGETVSYGMHEAQSLLWENLVGRSLAFWKHFFPRAQQVFPEALLHVSLEDFHFAVNEVRAQPIRVDADEITHNLHVLMRFEVERDLISGRMEAADVPSAWNEKSRQYLGIAPENDGEGCLQDIHWFEGLFGTFPSYALGSVYAAQIFAAAARALPELEEDFARGRFLPLRDWLCENIYRHGRRYDARQLVQRICGGEVDAGALVRYLKAKYLPLYGLA
ncbi:carboxypeptidase M32 [bacterium]|nr:carboxypeptidase M32 [bacterium]